MSEAAPDYEAAPQQEENGIDQELLDAIQSQGEAQEPDAEGQVEEEVPEEIEFDFGGDKLRVARDSIPEDVANRVTKFTRDIWAKHTKNSQQLAERSRAIQQQQQSLEQAKNLNQDTLRAYAQGLAIKEELEQLNDVDTSALWREDPDQARQVSDYINQRKAEFNRIVQQVEDYEKSQNQAQVESMQQAYTQGREFIEKAIPNFPADDVVKHAVEHYGVDENMAKMWPLNPVLARMAHSAMLYDRATKSLKSRAGKNSGAPVTGMKPGTGRARSSNLSSMSPAEMAKHLGLSDD